MNLLLGLLLLQWTPESEFSERIITPRSTSYSISSYFKPSPATKRVALAPAIPDSTAIRRQAEKKVQDFLDDWKSRWLKSDETRATKLPHSQALPQRAYFTHCHPDPSATMARGAASMAEAGFPTVRPNYEVTNWSYRFFAKCATWMLGPVAGDGDESDRIDNALLPQFQTQIAKQRTELTNELVSAQRQFPGDRWIAGQTVRFLIDAGKSTDAIRAARACRADLWWCSTLTGYALYRANNMASADSAFTAGILALNGQQRCEWTDITLLLTTGAFTDGARGKYKDQTCEERLNSEEQFWWLSDPLLSDDGNDRRTEHFARKTLVLLHQATDKDEHYDWRPDHNYQVIQELITRYGWPTSAVWGGLDLDIAHNAYVSPLKTNLKVRPFEHRMSPYSTMEYSMGRVHLSPKWDILKDVSKAETDDWELYAPQGPGSTRDKHGDTWWPEEHMRYKPALLVQIPDGQLAFWRRQHDVRVAMAINIMGSSATHLKPLLDSIATTSLIVSDGPEKNELLSANSAPYNRQLNVSGSMKTRPSLMAVEIVGEVASAGGRRAYAGRTRFGITPPPALDSLHRDSLGISTPVFYIPSPNGIPPKDVDEMLPAMMGTTSVDSGGKVGVFWESYGIARGDSVDFAVNIYRADGESIFKRITTALRLGSPIGNVSIAWRDPDLGAGGVGGNVSVLPKSVTLDLSSLDDGNYWIEVSVKTPKREAVTGRRPIQIVRR